MIASLLLCLIIHNSQCVFSKVIIISNDNGTNGTECCVNGTCVFSSLYTALVNITSNTIINITSESVALNNSTRMGSGNLTNIKITGSNVTIMCNNSGSVYCESCDNVTMEGITWDSCGDPYGSDFAGVTFNVSNNVSLVNCTFQYSQITAVGFVKVSGRFNVSQCNFLSNKGKNGCGGLRISSGSVSVNLDISNSYFYNNGLYYNDYVDQTLTVDDETGSTMWYITITKTIFFSNMGAAYFTINGDSLFHFDELTFNNNIAGISSVAGIQFFLHGNSSLLVSNSLFANNLGGALWWLIQGNNRTEIFISNSTFINTSSQLKLSKFAVSTIQLLPEGCDVQITLVDVEISDSISGAINSEGSASLYIGFLHTYDKFDVDVNMTRVRLLSNKYLGDIGGAVYIHYSAKITQHNSLIFKECDFFNNTSHRGAALYIENFSYNGGTITILNSKFDHNSADDSIIYINSKSYKEYMRVTVESSIFTNNVASCIHLIQSKLTCKNIVFANNTADIGAAVYIDQGSAVSIDDGGIIHFINNSAAAYGGAIYINLVYTCPDIPFTYDNSEVLFVNNTAEIAGNSLYFNIPAPCHIVENTSDPDSILNIPCQFNYSQPVNGTMMQHIPCDLDYTLLNGTGAPIVTSPHELRLYFPYNEGHNISPTTRPNTYFIKNNILGLRVKFNGAVFDYFGKPAEPIQFYVKCVECVSVLLSKIHFVVDNITLIGITFSGSNIESKLNATVMLISARQSIKKINTTLVIELLPCADHPGYTYSAEMKMCTCYNHNVNCYDGYNEIKKGYWVGSVKNTTTTAPCLHYCMFDHRKETRQGYFELPNTIDAQCNHYRTGRACGECSSII